MKSESVFIVFWWERWEPSEVYRVYRNQDKAEQVAQDRRGLGYNSTVEEHEFDAEPEGEDD